jgi:elongation factor P
MLMHGQQSGTTQKIIVPTYAPMDSLKNLFCDHMHKRGLRFHNAPYFDYRIIPQYVLKYILIFKVKVYSIIQKQNIIIYFSGEKPPDMKIEDVKKNVKLLYQGKPWNVDSADFVKPGKGSAIYKLRLKNLIDNSVLDVTFRSADKVDEASISNQDMQYLYKEGDHYVFMNTQNFEQTFVPESLLGDKVHFLKEGVLVNMQLWDDRPTDITIPTFVELAVVETGSSIKTATVTAQNKAAKLETGYSMDVPAFIKEGDILKIDTRTGNYVERLNPKK